ncbi:MAG: Fe-S-containing protein [Terriglobia bacterium]|jgi:FTR1 family protein
MFQSLVITLREGVEAALIIGIVLAYLAKTGRHGWTRLVWGGVTAAVGASLVAAYLVHRLQVGEDAYEGWLMVVGALFVASMVVWMWRTGRRMKQAIETKLAELSTDPARAAGLGVFLFVFLMVFREGIETVLFLAAVSLRSTDLLNFIGGTIGLALAVGLGVAFFKGSVKVDLRKFFAVTTLVLLFVAAQLLVTGVHELSEAQVLPSSQAEMALVGPIVNNDAFFFVVIIALCLFLIAAQKIQVQGRGVAATQDSLSAPERRKALAEWRRVRFWKMAGAGASLLIIVLISAQFIDSRAAQAVSPPERVDFVQGVARIPTAELADRKLHRYVVTVPPSGTEVRLIAILDDSDTVRVGLDACQICGSKGYYQDGKNVICRNCAAAIDIPTIGMAGGCNPIHVDFVVEGGSLVFSESALAVGAKYFK